MFQELGNPFYQGIKINEQWQVAMETDSEGNKDESANESDDDDKLEAVKKYQSKQDSHTCMIPRNPTDMVFVNETNEAVEKKNIGKSSTKSVVAPGEGHIPTNW